LDNLGAAQAETRRQDALDAAARATGKARGGKVMAVMKSPPKAAPKKGKR
jgi:hypothetical protein